jgi:hypothetical protein
VLAKCKGFSAFLLEHFTWDIQGGQKSGWVIGFALERVPKKKEKKGKKRANQQGGPCEIIEKIHRVPPVDFPIPKWDLTFWLKKVSDPKMGSDFLA